MKNPKQTSQPETPQAESSQISKRDAILETAFKLFSLKGFANTSTRELAKAANVNEVTIFRHFQSKENLLDEVIKKYAPVPEIDKALEYTQSLTFEEGFVFFVKVFLSQIEREYPVFRLLHMEAAFNPEIKAMVGHVPALLRKTLSKHLERGVREGKVREDVDLELTAQFMMWIFLGYEMSQFDIGYEIFPFKREEISQTTISLFLKGLAPETQS